MKHERTLKFIYRCLIRVPAQFASSLSSPSSSEVTSIRKILQAGGTLVSQIYILEFNHTQHKVYVLEATCFGSILSYHQAFSKNSYTVHWIQRFCQNFYNVHMWSISVNIPHLITVTELTTNYSLRYLHNFGQF